MRRAAKQSAGPPVSVFKEYRILRSECRVAVVSGTLCPVGRHRTSLVSVVGFACLWMVLAAVATGQTGTRSSRAWHEALAEAAARRAGIDLFLLRALIEVESAWIPDAVSVDGALGLMQILPSTAADYAADPDLTDPAVNLAVGVVHFRGLIDRHGVVRALAAWNRARVLSPAGGSSCPTGRRAVSWLVFSRS